MKRGFEIVRENFIKNNKKTQLPTRGSKDSAGYDFYAKENKILKTGESHVFWTDVKAYMQPGEVLKLFVRSSIGIKKGLVLANTTGIIDRDYYSNDSNDGNIGICLRNITNENQVIQKGERIAQGIFEKFLESDNGNTEESRIGGIGSTNK